MTLSPRPVVHSSSSPSPPPPTVVIQHNLTGLGQVGRVGRGGEGGGGRVQIRNRFKAHLQGIRRRARRARWQHVEPLFRDCQPLGFHSGCFCSQSAAGFQLSKPQPRHLRRGWTAPVRERMYTLATCDMLDLRTLPAQFCVCALTNCWITPASGV